MKRKILPLILIASSLVGCSTKVKIEENTEVKKVEEVSKEQEHKRVQIEIKNTEGKEQQGLTIYRELKNNQNLTSDFKTLKDYIKNLRQTVKGGFLLTDEINVEISGAEYSLEDVSIIKFEEKEEEIVNVILTKLSKVKEKENIFKVDLEDIKDYKEVILKIDVRDTKDGKTYEVIKLLKNERK